MEISDEVDRCRTGLPFSLAVHDMNLSSIIAKSNKDWSGKTIGPSSQARMNRLRMWDTRTRFYGGARHNLTTAFALLNSLKDKLGLPHTVIERTAYVYRKVQEKELVKGITISSSLVACLYVA